MVELVDNHVLFPHPANWARRPDWSRTWQSGIATAVNGSETRASLRQFPRASLSVTITPRSVTEQSRFDDRIRAALKSGLACLPYHGRGSVLAEAASLTTAVLADNGWPWDKTQYAFFQTADDNYEVREVLGAILDAGLWTVTLAAPLDAEYPAKVFVWPLVFGKFTCDEMAARSPIAGPATITIRELGAAASAQLGEVEPPEGEGIGYWTVATDLLVQ